METKVIVGAPKDVATPLLAVGLYEGEPALSNLLAELNEAFGGLIARLIADREITGKLNETIVLYPQTDLPAQRLVLVGLGKASDLDLDKVRQAAGSVAKRVTSVKVNRFAIDLLGKGVADLTDEALAQVVVEGVSLATYQYNVYKSNKGDLAPAVEEMTIIAAGSGSVQYLEDGVQRGEITSGAVITARDLANGPGNLVTPSYLVEQARTLASKYGMNLEVFDQSQMSHLGMGAFLGVAQGSDQPAYMIVLHYQGAGKDKPVLALVGKGITFDSGGISIKPSEGMPDMKYDMAGGAAVLGAMQGLAAMKAPVNVVGIVPATENLPSGHALKPGDVVTASNGKTIEIITTDAEGRLILADALAYAVKLDVAAIVDIATLTGACVIALGHVAAGLMGNNDDLLAMIEKSSEATGERVWRLPLWPQYKELIKSDIADIKNTGGRYGGSITGGAFLGNFSGDKPWAHIDIAGMSDGEKPGPYTAKGGSGFGARLLIDFALRWAKNQQYAVIQ